MAIFRIERKIFSEIDYLEYLQELEERMYAASGAKKRAEDGLHNAVMHDNKAKKLRNKYEYLAEKIKNGEYTWESLSKTGKYGSFVNDPKHRKAIEGLMDSKSNAASQSARVQNTDIPKSTKNGNSFAKASEEKIKETASTPKNTASSTTSKVKSSTNTATKTVNQRSTSIPSNLGKTSPNKFRLNRKHALIGAGVGLGLAGAGYLYNKNKNKEN